MNNSLEEEEPDKHQEWNEEYEDEDDEEEEEDEVNDHPIEEVRLTVPPTDDPTLPAFTFRTLVIGLASCCLLAFVNQFFGYRQNQLYIGSISVQIVALPLGKLMAATLPTKHFNIPLTSWRFTLNPGPFNVKEHVLITIFANSGASSVYALHIVTSVKAFYKREIHLAAAFLLSQTTQMLGYGWAGLFRRYLVDSPYMWWPANLVQVSLFRALHDHEERKKGGLTKLQFFIIVFVSSFSYYIIPGYLFPAISAISIACFVWKDSIVAQQVGSGLHGLGIGSFGLDWSTVAGFLGSPLATPAFAIVNILGGFFLIVYVALPLLYYNNVYEARRFPMISSKTFDYSGNRYNINRVLDRKTFTLDIAAYDSYSKLYLSTFFAFTYGLSFASLMATISHVALFTGKLIWQRSRETKEAAKKNYMDVHTRLMKQNYAEVPQWWFYIILVSMMILAIFTCEGFDGQLQLPWWGVLLACAMALVFTLPIGIIVATTNMGPGLNVITELVIGYLLPGKPLANVAFKTYGYISMSQGLTFLSDFKLGHYMKIPPKSMFITQLMSSIVASSVYFGTAWWLLTTVENICDVSKLPVGSPWTCPTDDVFYSASIIWGVVGPKRMFSIDGLYPELNWFFVIGLLAPVPIWALIQIYPEKRWLYYINMPIILGASQGMPPARSVNYITWGAVGLFFNLYIYKRFKSWWARHNYILSAGLDAGVAFMGILIFLALQSFNILGPDWWGLNSTDNCKLASCPTAPGVRVRGCPVH